jgi:hypothetical protein
MVTVDWYPEGESRWYDHATLAPCWAQLPGGPVAEYQGECWQYMGSVWGGQAAYHSFRHRAHPAYGDRIYAWFEDSERGCVPVAPFPVTRYGDGA